MVWTVGVLAARRTQGEKSEDEIATELGFKGLYGESPAQCMYKRLKEWDLPDWIVKPQSLLDETTADPASPKPKKKPQRVVRTTGETLELPPASGAEDLLREQIFQHPPGPRNSWRGSLEEDLNELHRLKEWLVGENRFVATHYDEETRELQYKHDFNEEQWIAMCEAQGEDPQSEAIEVPVPPAVTHSTRQPWGMDLSHRRLRP